MTTTPPPPPSNLEIIEHVALFNVNDINNQEPNKVNALVKSLNTLSTINSVLYLTAGPIFNPRSFPSTLKFTHMLHARYPTRAALTHYYSHEKHVSVANTIVKPICDDNMACDWPIILSGDGPISPKVGSGMVFKVLRVHDAYIKEKVFQGLKKIKESLLGSFSQISCGENFCVERGKGFSVAILGVFNDLNASQEFDDRMKLLIDEFNVVDDDIIAVDYVVS